MKYFMFLTVFFAFLCANISAAKSFNPKITLSKILATKKSLKSPQQESIETLISQEIKKLERSNAFSTISFILGVLIIVADKSAEDLSIEEIFGIVASKLLTFKIDLNQKFVLGDSGYTGTLLHLMFARRTLFDYISAKVNYDRNYYLGSFELDFNRLKSLQLDNITECDAFINLLIFAGAKTDIPDSKGRTYQDLVKAARERFPFSAESGE